MFLPPHFDYLISTVKSKGRTDGKLLSVVALGRVCPAQRQKLQTNCKLTVGSFERSGFYLQGSRPLVQQLFYVPGCSGHQLLRIILLHSVEVLVS